MPLKPQTSFSAGELDPILHDRVTLERFQNGLHTARNVMIGKSGSIMSRFGRFLFKKVMHDNIPVKIYCPPNSGKIVECGVFAGASYITIYDFSGNIVHTYDPVPFVAPFTFTEASLKKLHFVTNRDEVFIFGGSDTTEKTLKFTLSSTFTILQGSFALQIPSWPGATITGTSYTSSGYAIDYAITAVINGEETEPMILLNSTIGAAQKKPISVAEHNNLVFTIDTLLYTAPISSYNEFRIYQRPAEGSAFGFLGRTTNITASGTDIVIKFTDIGGNPDYTTSTPTLVSKERLSNETFVGNIKFGTGTIYQQRLLMGNAVGVNAEAILASRPGFQNNFYRDFPYSADSALNFKAGTSGNAKVLRIIESDGLVVFTSAGVFVSLGVLSVDNLALVKRGNWIIDELVPPLVVPGGLFFVDKTTNTVKQLIYSQELASYDSSDQSIFSNHLFKRKTIKSWAYQEGTAPIIIVVFSDGSFATYTYSFEHQIKAWTRHDSAYPIEQVEATEIADTTIFLINKNGTRYIEMTVPRTIPADVYATNPEAEKTAYGAFMDSLTVKVNLLNDSLVGTDTFVLTPVVADDWEGHLTLTCGTSGLFLLAGNGAVGTTFRFFDPIDQNSIDLVIVSRTNNNTVVVQPSEEFPSEYGSGFRMYLTHLSVTGLAQLEGEEVAVISDGNIISSPFNDNEGDSFTNLSVTGGVLTLSERSAITIVGRPIVADIKTLNVNTAEQSPTALESMTANKTYVRTIDSRGLFVSNEYPEEKDGEIDGTSVEGMQSLDDYYLDDSAPIIGNRSKRPNSRRHEVLLSGKYEGNAQIAMRQVDPVHFEIMSIVLDIELFGRSNR